MQSIFDQAVREEVLGRIRSLTPAHRPNWGIMTVEQMVRHCTLCEAYYQGNVPIRRSLLGRVIGRHAIRQILAGPAPVLRKNAPTPASFKVTGLVVDLEAEKRQWASLIDQYKAYDRAYFVHWFFGKMTREQLGQFIYVHCNHHLTQFGV